MLKEEEDEVAMESAAIKFRSHYGADQSRLWVLFLLLLNKMMSSLEQLSRPEKSIVLFVQVTNSLHLTQCLVAPLATAIRRGRNDLGVLVSDALS